MNEYFFNNLGPLVIHSDGDIEIKFFKKHSKGDKLNCFARKKASQEAGPYHQIYPNRP